MPDQHESVVRVVRVFCADWLFFNTRVLMCSPHLTWADTAMHDIGSLRQMLQIELPKDWVNLALDYVNACYVY